MSPDKRTPEQIRAEIDATREELGDTVEALAEKTDVKAHAQAKIEEVRRNPKPVAIAVAGIVIVAFLLWRWRRT